LGVCKGKKLVDKREEIKRRDIKRDLEREFRDK
jgi:tmRNA-binding protein